LRLNLRQAALLTSAAAIALFVLIASNVTGNSNLVAFDLSLAQWFHAHATPALTRVALFYTHIHGTIGILSMSAVLMLYLLRIKNWRWLIAVPVTVLGGMLINLWFKHVFVRARPVFEQPLLVMDSFSFPSGHTVGATVFYSVLAAWLCSRPVNQSRGRRSAIIGLALLLTVLTGLTRIYLGVHYFSDVVAGMLEGVCWFLLTAILVLQLPGSRSGANKQS